MFKRQKKVWGIKTAITLIAITFLFLAPILSNNIAQATHVPEPDHSLTGSSNYEEYRIQVYDYLVEHGWDPEIARRTAINLANTSSSGAREQWFKNSFRDLRGAELTVISESDVSCPSNPPTPNHNLNQTDPAAQQYYANQVIVYLVCNGIESYDNAVIYAKEVAVFSSSVRATRWANLLFEYSQRKSSGESDTTGITKDVKEEAIQASRNKIQDIGECGVTNLGACAYDVMAWLFNFLIYATGLLLSFAAAVFRLVLKISILEFAPILDNEGTRFAWRTLRDIANLFFIFILLYAAIGTILRVQRIDAKKIVVNVVVVAIFINFSFLISKLIIDAGNQLALFFYDRITEDRTVEIDEKLMTALRFVDTVKLTGDKNVSYVNEETGQVGDIKITSTAKSLADLPSLMVKGIGAIIIIVLTAFIIGSAAYMFLARAVVLALLAVTSPLAFLLMAFPDVGAAGGVSSQWWSKMVNQSLVAPAYLILLWAVLIIVTGGGANFDHGGAIGDALYYFIVAYMLYWSFSIAIAMGGYGADQAKNMYNDLRKKVTNKAKNAAVTTATGTAGFVGRNTIGLGAAKLANSEIVRNYASKSPLLGGRMLLKGLDATSNASFGGRKGGYIKDVEDKEKKEKEHIERLGKDKVTGGKWEGKKKLVSGYGEDGTWGVREVQRDYSKEYGEKLGSNIGYSRVLGSAGAKRAVESSKKSTTSKENKKKAQDNLEERTKKLRSEVKANESRADDHPDKLSRKEVIDLEDKIAQMELQLENMRALDDLSAETKKQGEKKKES